MSNIFFPLSIRFGNLFRLFSNFIKLTSRIKNLIFYFKYFKRHKKSTTYSPHAEFKCMHQPQKFIVYLRKCFYFKNYLLIDYIHTFGPDFWSGSALGRDTRKNRETRFDPMPKDPI